jgi:hypothetical protein
MDPQGNGECSEDLYSQNTNRTDSLDLKTAAVPFDLQEYADKIVNPEDGVSFSPIRDSGVGIDGSSRVYVGRILALNVLKPFVYAISRSLKRASKNPGETQG